MPLHRRPVGRRSFARWPTGLPLARLALRSPNRHQRIRPIDFHLDLSDPSRRQRNPGRFAIILPMNTSIGFRVAAASALIALDGEIPPDIPWILRVDGHTDKKPVSGAGSGAEEGAAAEVGHGAKVGGWA